MNAIGTARYLMSWAAMAFLVVAAISKFSDIRAFQSSLHTWSAVPTVLHPAIAVIIPSLELILGMTWICGFHVKKVRWLATALVAGFTAGYALHWLLLKRPECECVSLLASYFSMLEEGRWVIPRNTIVMAFLIAGTDSRQATESAIESPRQTRISRTSGFTLVEMLLVIALIGILISLALPSLGRLRDLTKRSITLSNLRTHMVAASTYTIDFKDLMPYATSPVARYSVLRCRSKGVAVRARYFDMMNRWNIALADGYYDGNLSSKIFVSPLNRFAQGRVDAVVLGTDYWYSCSFLASPEFFDEASRLFPSTQFRAVRLSEVVFPHYKIVFADNAAPISIGNDDYGTLNSAFSDGHVASACSDSDLVHYSGDGLESRVSHGGHFPGSLYPLLHTSQGVRGRDVK
jgi:prepilin-type N-terminal cleavage/methylation domain-containing protein